MKVVYVFEPHKIGIAILEQEGVSFAYYPGRQAPREWLEKELADAQVIVVPPWVQVDRSFFDIAPRVKLLVVHGSGVDKVDVEEATRRGVCVANAPDAIAETVADHVVGLILAHYRNIVRGDRYIREGKWSSGSSAFTFTGYTLRGKQVGVVGLGRIGSAVCKRLKPFGVKLVYWDRRAKAEVEHALDVHRLDLDTLIETSDVVVVAISLTPETRGLINRERVYKLKKGALLVNVSRGQVVDEEALIERLKEGEIHAALDVYSVEPLPPSSPLLKLENTILTPHIAGVSREALEETSVHVAKIIVDFVKRRKLPDTVVNVCAVRASLNLD